MTAEQFIAGLFKYKNDAELKNVQQYFRYEGVESKFLGIRMSKIFELAKQYVQMPLDEIKKLLHSEFYEIRMGAVSIMDFQARDKKITPAKRKALFDLYISNHRHINNWDMVDRSAPYVVGGYLNDKPRKLLYKLAKSKNVWERRTAIVSTYFFIRQNDLDDTFKIAEILINDQHDLIQKAVGSWIREAGKKDNRMLVAFLDKHAANMPRTTLRYAIEKIDKKLRDHYLKAGKETE
ncbi:MAG TPA: DNA alkylation repair protein [Chitinophagaceae bacterium]|nr:DNA alkylation repair protein [Chitinophagaceae bacterium]